MISYVNNAITSYQTTWNNRISDKELSVHFEIFATIIIQFSQLYTFTSGSYSEQLYHIDNIGWYRIFTHKYHTFPKALQNEPRVYKHKWHCVWKMRTLFKVGYNNRNFMQHKSSTLVSKMTNNITEISAIIRRWSQALKLIKGLYMNASCTEYLWLQHAVCFTTMTSGKLRIMFKCLNFKCLIRRGGVTPYIRRQHRSSLVHTIACRLTGAKPLSEPMLEYYIYIYIWSYCSHFWLVRGIKKHNELTVKQYKRNKTQICTVLVK